jgi:uncharacterized protein
VPVTSSRSSLKRWPSADLVLAEAGLWACRLAESDPDVVAVGYFGSYARGDASFGSDLDLLVVRRDGASVPDLLGADVAALLVPADIVHYTASELRALLESGTRVAAVIERQARWWVGGPGTPAPPAPGPSP